MRNLHARLARIEQNHRDERRDRDAGHRMLMRHLCRSQLALQPDLAHVTAADADPETFRWVSATRAWANSDFDLAERLEAADPHRGPAAFLEADNGDHAEALRRWNNAGVAAEDLLRG